MPEVQKEIEVKFCDVDHDAVRRQLEATGASLKTAERLMRRKVYGGEANPQMHCTYGRIRDEGEVITMSAKFSAVGGNIESQKEAQVIIDNFENAEALLEAFGLTATDYQENKRETWQYPDGTLVELESWPELPSYIEIEGPSVDALRAVADKLGMEWDTHTTDSTDKLYLRHFAASMSEADIRKKMQHLVFAG